MSRLPLTLLLSSLLSLALHGASIASAQDASAQDASAQDASAQDTSAQDTSAQEPSSDGASAGEPASAASAGEAVQPPEAPLAYREASPEVRVAQAVGVDSAELRLADIHRRSRSATALYISSFVLLGTGVGGMVFGTVLLVAGSFGGSTGGAGAALFVGGGVVTLGHVITLALATERVNAFETRVMRILCMEFA